MVTNTSWSATAMAANTNITESGVPMLSPSRFSHCVESSNEACSCPPPNLTLYLFLLILIFIIFLYLTYKSRTLWSFLNEMFTQSWFSCQIKREEKGLGRGRGKTNKQKNQETMRRSSRLMAYEVRRQRQQSSGGPWALLSNF